MVNAQEVRAMRLVRAAINDGFMVSLFYEDDQHEPAIQDSVDPEAFIAEIHACDMMSVTIRKKDGVRTLGAWFLLIFEPGTDDTAPISDYTDNDIGNRFYKLVMG